MDWVVGNAPTLTSLNEPLGHSQVVRAGSCQRPVLTGEIFSTSSHTWFQLQIQHRHLWDQVHYQLAMSAQHNNRARHLSASQLLSIKTETLVNNLFRQHCKLHTIRRNLSPGVQPWNDTAASDRHSSLI